MQLMFTVIIMMTNNTRNRDLLESKEFELLGVNLRDLLVFVTILDEQTTGYASLLNSINVTTTRTDRTVMYRTITDVFTVTSGNRRDRRQMCMQWPRCCTNKIFT